MPISMFQPRTALTGCVGIAALVVAAQAYAASDMPDSENGRYSFSQTADGVLRLDTRSGNISTCTNRATGWACYAAPDERAALDAEIGRLQAENERLKVELAKQGKTEGPVERDEAGKRGKKLELQLPSDQDVDRVMSFLERAWRKLLEMAGRVQKDVSGKI